MQSYPLDKLLTVGTDYYTEADKALVIKLIGTDSAAKATLKVAGAPCLETITGIAGLKMTHAQFQPLFDLKDLYAVVPPDSVFNLTGTASALLRIKGSLLDLAPGETLPAGLLARWTEQAKKFFSYQVAAIATDTAIAAGASLDLLTFTCPTGEKWLFDSLLFFRATVATDTIDYGLTARILLQDKPWDNLVNSKLLLGLNQYGTPYPPSHTDGMNVFSLKEKPIEVAPGQVLKIQVVNTTDGELTVEDVNTKVLIVGKQEYIIA